MPFPAAVSRKRSTDHVDSVPLENILILHTSKVFYSKPKSGCNKSQIPFKSPSKLLQEATLVDADYHKEFHVQFYDHGQFEKQ